MGYKLLKQKFEYTGDNSYESVQEFCKERAEYEQLIVDFKLSNSPKTIVEDSVAIYALEPWEKLENGVVTDISETTEYINKVKTETKKQITLTYKDKFNEFDGVYAARVARGLSTTSEMNTKRTALQTELTTKLQEVDNG